MDDASEWGETEPVVKPVTLEELLDFFETQEVGEDIPVKELLRRMGR